MKKNRRAFITKLRNESKIFYISTQINSNTNFTSNSTFQLTLVITMKRSCNVVFLLLIGLLLTCVNESLAKRIYCHNDCEDGPIVLPEDQVCTFNGLYFKVFPSRCYMNQHNTCFNTSKIFHPKPCQMFIKILLLDYKEVEMSKCDKNSRKKRF